MARVAPDATAWANRKAHFVMNAHTRWRGKDQDSACIAWARGLFEAAAPFASGSVYVNFMPEDQSDRVENAYGANYRRLAEIKRRYDPDNRFRMNQNIGPGPGGAKANASWGPGPQSALGCGATSKRIPRASKSASPRGSVKNQ
jgi:hypothetical protein